MDRERKIIHLIKEADGETCEDLYSGDSHQALVETYTMGSGFKADLEECLARFTEFASDTGTATGGTITTLTDTGKNWETDMWVDAILEVYVEADSIYYLRTISSNTADTLTFATLPVGKTVASGDDYAIRLVEVLTQTEAMAGQAPVGVNVGVASTAILAANTSRRAAVITNDSDRAVWIAIGQTAVANDGIRLNAHGGTITLSRHGALFSTEAINGIHDGTGNKVVCGQEFE